MKRNTFVSSNSNIQGGQACIIGTRIPVADLVFLVKQKSIDPKLIVTKYFTQLSLDQVRGALEWHEHTAKRYA